MTTENDWTAALTGLPKKLLLNPLIQLLLLSAIALGLYNNAAIPALINSAKSTQTAAVADNAKLRQQAEAAIADQKSITTAAVAANAPRKQAADARKAAAAALKTAAEKEIAEAKAGVADPQTAAEAAAKASLARITEQQAIVEKEKAKQSARKLRAEAESKQINVAIFAVTTMIGQLKLKLCIACDPTYCILCEKHYVPDLPSGADLPPPEEGEASSAPPAEPIITVLSRNVPWQADSECDRLYRTWTATLSYGAFTAPCELSAGEHDLATAKRKAMAACTSSPYNRNCSIVSIITPAAPKIATPPAHSVLTRLGSGSIEIGGSCHDRFNEWKARPGNGAFALGQHRCGFASEADTLEHAKAQAIETCSDDDCTVVYQLTAADSAVDQPIATVTAAAAPGNLAHGTVVPEKLNVHNEPNPDAASVIGKLDRRQTVVITGTTGGDFIAIEATCDDGRPCKGYVNGRAEFIAR